MHEFPLQTALNKEGPAWGSWLTLPSTAVARTLASTPGMSVSILLSDPDIQTDCRCSGYVSTRSMG
jgi:hypothetical protein